MAFYFVNRVFIRQRNEHNNGWNLLKVETTVSFYCLAYFFCGQANHNFIFILFEFKFCLNLSFNDFLSCFSSIVNRDEALNTREAELEKIEQNIKENKESIAALEMQKPLLKDRFDMYQEMRIFVRDLLECLNEKVFQL